MQSGEFAKRTGLTKNAVGGFWDGLAHVHSGGTEDATITLTAGTLRGLVGFTIATSNWTAGDTFAIYRGTVAAGTSLTGALPLHAGDFMHEVLFDEPVIFDASVVTVRLVSTGADTITMAAHYHHD